MRITTSIRRIRKGFLTGVIAGFAALLMVLTLAPGASAAAGGWEDTFDTTRRVATTSGTKVSGEALKLAEGPAAVVGDPNGAVPGETAVLSMVAVGNDVYSGTGEKGHLVRYNPEELYQEAYQGPSHKGVSNSRGQVVGGLEKEVTALTYDGAGHIYGGTGGTGAEGHVFSFDTADPGKMCVDIGIPEEGQEVTSIACFGGLVYVGTDSADHIFSYTGGSPTELAMLPGSGKPAAMAVVGGKLYIGMDNGKVFSYDGTFNEVAGVDTAVNALAVSGTVLYIGGASGHLFSYESAPPGAFTDLGSPASPDNPIASLAVRSGVVFAGMNNGHVWSHVGVIWADQGTVPNGDGKPVNALAVSADNVLYGGTGDDQATSTGRLFRLAVDVYEPHGGPAGATAVTGIALRDKKLYFSTRDKLYTYEGPGPGPSSYVDQGAPLGGSTINDIDSPGTQGIVMVGLANGDLYTYREDGHPVAPYAYGSPVNSVDHQGTVVYAGLANGKLMRAGAEVAVGTTDGGEAINDLANKSDGGGAENGEYIGAADGKLYLWDGDTFAPVGGPPADTSAVNALAVYGDSVFIGHESGKVYKYSGGGPPELVDTCPEPVISMATGAQGVIVGTSGNHIYACDTTTTPQLHDQGAVPDGTSPDVLSNVNSSIWIGGANGKLYAHDSSNLGDRGQQVKKQIMVWCMTYDGVNNLYYAGTYQNAHFLVINPVTDEVLDCGRPVDGERELEDILVMQDGTGTVYGATYGGTEELHNPDGGHLFAFDPVARRFDDKGKVPSANWWVSSLVEIGNTGTVFGATCNSAGGHTGSLFTYDGTTWPPANLGNLDVLNDTLGAELADEGPRSLIYDSANSKIYGGTHDPTTPTISHVFSCDSDGANFTAVSSPVTGDDNAVTKIRAVQPGGAGLTNLYCAQNDGYVFWLTPPSLNSMGSFRPVASGTTVLGLANGPDNTLLCGTGQLSTTTGGHLASYDPSLQQTRDIPISEGPTPVTDDQAVACLAVGTVLTPDPVQVTYGGTKGNEAPPGNWSAGKIFKVPPYRNTGTNTATSTVIDPAVTELSPPPLPGFAGQGITALCPSPAASNEVYVGNVDSGGTASLYKFIVAIDGYTPPPGQCSWPLPVPDQDRILSLAPGPDGKVYIGTGGPTNGHLMVFDPQHAELGITDLTPSPPWSAKGIFAITTGPDGKIYLGTGDDTGNKPNVYSYSGGAFTRVTLFGVGPDQAGRITSLVTYGGKVFGVTSANPGVTQSATFFRVTLPSTVWDGIPPEFGTEFSAVSLVQGPNGRLYCGTGPAGKLIEVTNATSGTPTFAEIPDWPLGGKGVTAMAGTPDAIYGCAGSEGNLFKWTPSGGIIDKGPITVLNAGVPSATTDNLGKPYFGTAGDGTAGSVQLVRYNPNAAFAWGQVLFDASDPASGSHRVEVRNESNSEDIKYIPSPGTPLGPEADGQRALRLQATLTSTDPDQLRTPLISDWSIDWNKKASLDRLDYQHSEGAYKGEQFAIWGADFGASMGTVTFPGAGAVTPDQWWPNYIVVTVPQAATAGSLVIHPTDGNLASVPTAYNLLSDPHVTSLTPGSGRVGDVLTIRGTGFLAARGSEDTVTFNGVAAASYPTWSDTLIKAQVPGGAATGDVYVSVNAHTSNAVPFTVQAGGGPTVRITDPSPGAAVKGTVIVNATVQKQGGTTPVELWVDGRKSASDAGAPYSFNWNADAVADGAHLLTVKATDGFGRTGSASITLYVDHTVPSANTNWYFAEGCTDYGFETWLLLDNPSASAVSATLTLMNENGAPVPVGVELKPHSRTSIDASRYVGAASFSTNVAATSPIMVERAMYWSGRSGGTDSIGAR